MEAIHSSDLGVKEHLIERVNDLEKVCMEKGTELIFTRRSMESIANERQALESRASQAEFEL